MDNETIIEHYDIITLNPVTSPRVAAVRRSIRDAAILINTVCDECSESHMALTKLEEACMWATVGIARTELAKQQGELE